MEMTPFQPVVYKLENIYQLANDAGGKLIEMVMWGSEAGSLVMKRIAAPMVGGLISSTILTLIIIPAVYDIWKRWELKNIE